MNVEEGFSFPWFCVFVFFFFLERRILEWNGPSSFLFFFKFCVKNEYRKF